MNCRICNSILDHTGLCPNCGFDEGLAYEYYPTLQQLVGLSLSGRRKNWEEKIAAQNSIPARNVKCEFKNGTLRVSGTESIGAADLQKLVAGSTSGKPALDKIKKVIIEEGIKTIEDDCFANCTSLEGVVLPNGLLSIGKSAFCLCHQLTTLEIPDSCTSIGNNAFSFCRSLCSIHLPRELTKIESYLFWGCESLASIIIPDRVRSIGDRAFAQCGNLTSITIPDSVREISHNSFLSCRNLKDIYYSGTIEKWNALTIPNNGPYFPDAVIHYGTPSASIASPVITPPDPAGTIPDSKGQESSAQSKKSVFSSRTWTIIIVVVHMIFVMFMAWFNDFDVETDTMDTIVFNIILDFVALLSLNKKAPGIILLFSSLCLGFITSGLLFLPFGCLYNILGLDDISSPVLTAVMVIIVIAAMVVGFPIGFALANDNSSDDVSEQKKD